jgi:putative spermidine/putrescine transport system substrate-binding protein
MKKLSRRKALTYLGGAAAGGASLFARRGIAAPAVSEGTVLTVSTWGGVTQNAIAAHAGPEFSRATGAALAFDIGSQGSRYSKLLAQRASPTVDVFFGSDEALVGGLKAGILTPARRKNLSNLGDVEKWALTVPSPAGDDTVGGVPYGLIVYAIGYNPEEVKAPITSWADLWRPEFSGKLAFASPFHSMMPALVVIAAELAGGSMQDVDPGFKKLAELRPAKLQFTWTDWAALYQSGDVMLATEFDCYLDVMKNKKYPIEYVMPKEKGLACIDGVALVNGRPNRELAEFFLDTILSRKTQAGLAADLFQGPINSKVDLPADLKAKCNCGANVAELRFFDPAPFVALRPVWAERLTTEVVPKWGTR